MLTLLLGILSVVRDNNVQLLLLEFV